MKKFKYFICYAPIHNRTAFINGIFEFDYDVLKDRMTLSDCEHFLAEQLYGERELSPIGKVIIININPIKNKKP